VMDTALALVNLNYVATNHAFLNQEIKHRQLRIEEICRIQRESLIVPIKVESNALTLVYQEKLQAKGYLVGAIRQPTVSEPILRIIPRLGTSLEDLASMLYEVF